MPIFEHDDPISNEEMRRQQIELNLKVFRKEMTEAFDVKQQDKFDGGDCWEEDE